MKTWWSDFPIWWAEIQNIKSELIELIRACYFVSSLMSKIFNIPKIFGFKWGVGIKKMTPRREGKVIVLYSNLVIHQNWWEKLQILENSDFANARYGARGFSSRSSWGVLTLWKLAKSVLMNFYYSLFGQLGFMWKIKGIIIFLMNNYCQTRQILRNYEINFYLFRY